MTNILNKNANLLKTVTEANTLSSGFRHANDNPHPSHSFTSMELNVIRRIMRGENVQFSTSGLTKNAWHDLMHRLGRETITLAS